VPGSDRRAKIGCATSRKSRAKTPQGPGSLTENGFVFQGMSRTPSCAGMRTWRSCHHRALGCPTRNLPGDNGIWLTHGDIHTNSAHGACSLDTQCCTRFWRSWTIARTRSAARRDPILLGWHARCRKGRRRRSRITRPHHRNACRDCAGW
jgi:hypothetical protein